MSNPSVTTLSALRPALQAAHKYEIPSAIEGLRAALVSPSLLKTDPLGVYALACEFQLTEETKAASRGTLAFDILAVPLDTPLLEHITAKDYLRLVRLHQSRAEAAIAAINCMSPMPHNCCGYVSPTEENSDSSSRSNGGAYVRWWATWKDAAIPELKARPRTDVVFDSGFLLSHVKRASRHCHDCGTSFMASATQAWLAVMKERIDALPSTI